jgi:hypothetical protein
MDFIALILFLSFYYLRPQEWTPGWDAFHPIQLLSVLAIIAMIQGGKLRPRDLLKTPLDWLVLLYFLWTLVAGLQFFQSLSEIQSVLLFYFVAVRSLETIRRQKTFLTCWFFFIIVIAALAVASMYGFDPLHSNDITQGSMKGRLILNLSIFDNPNSLAHSIVPALPLIYYLFVWRKMFLKVVVVLAAIPIYCILLTQSKGAYLSCFATLLATMTFGRSKKSQLVVVVLAVVFGYGALYSLPRMSELNNSKTDPAIQGRVAAFTYGMKLMQDNWMGIGLGQFKDSFLHEGPLEEQTMTKVIPARKPNGVADEEALKDRNPIRERLSRWVHYIKATHSSFNENGAELGYVGLFLFVSILYWCIRTLLMIRCETNDEERIRRVLFAMVVAYAVSSWMVDFCYRPTFFLFVAAISGLQRYFLLKQAEQAAETVSEIAAMPAWRQRMVRQMPAGIRVPGLPIPIISGGGLLATPTPALAMMRTAATVTLEPPAMSRLPAWHRQRRPMPWEAQPEQKREHKPWLKPNQFTLFDLVMMFACTYAAILYWQHLIATM